MAHLESAGIVGRLLLIEPHILAADVAHNAAHGADLHPAPRGVRQHIDKVPRIHLAQNGICGARTGADPHLIPGDGGGGVIVYRIGGLGDMLKSPVRGGHIHKFLGVGVRGETVAGALQGIIHDGSHLAAEDIAVRLEGTVGIAADPTGGGCLADVFHGPMARHIGKAGGVPGGQVVKALAHGGDKLRPADRLGGTEGAVSIAAEDPQLG